MKFLFLHESRNDYAEQIIKNIDPNHEYIDGIYCRDKCLKIKISHDHFALCKDLKLIKNRKLKNMVIVDNLCTSFGNMH